MVAKILKVESDGLLLAPGSNTPTRGEFWLPASEWDDTESAWEREIDGLLPGDELDVLILDETRDSHGRILVSRRAFTLESVDSGWLYQPRLMRVEAVTRELIKGRIGSVPAFLRRAEYQVSLESKGLDQPLSDHAELAKDDFIGGIVARIRTPFGVELDFGQYLELREKEIRSDVRFTPERPEPNVSSTTNRAPRLPEHLAKQISPVLLVENETTLKASLEGFFRRGNVEVRSAGDLASAIRLIEEPERTGSTRFRLAVVDSNLSENGDDLGGLVAVERLSAMQSVPVLLITGEQTMTRKLTQMDRVLLHGFLPKPFTTRSLIEAIEVACVARPRPISHWVQVERLVEDRPSLERHAAGLTSRSGFPTIEDAITDLSRVRLGGVIHVFKLHPRSLRAQSIGHFGEGLRWESLRGKIEKSRIKDAAFSNDPIFETYDKQPALHYWTRQMMPYEAFYGTRISVPGSPFRYVLVAFYRTRDGFNESFHSAVKLCVERISRTIEREQWLRKEQAQQTFATIGMSLECLAHELYNDELNIDAAANELSILLERAEKFSALQKQEADEVAKRLRQFIAEAMGKTTTLRGVRTSKESVSVGFCLRRAVFGCRTVKNEIVGEPQRIVIEKTPASSPAEDTKVSAAPATLVIVLFNLFLNGVQQIDLSSSLRRNGKVWPVVEKRSDREGKHWLYVTVCDTGPGIHFDDWEEVFTAGYSTRPNGMGLGLAICRNLLKEIQHDKRSATLSVSASTIWDGSRFQLRLPISR